MIELKHHLTTEQQIWITNNVDVENIEYDFKEQTLTFLNDEDAVAFKLVFADKKRKQEIDLGFYYCPYIPLQFLEINIVIVDI